MDYGRAAQPWRTIRCLGDLGWGQAREAAFASIWHDVASATEIFGAEIISLWGFPHEASLSLHKQSVVLFIYERLSQLPSPDMTGSINHFHDQVLAQNKIGGEA